MEKCYFESPDGQITFLDRKSDVNRIADFIKYSKNEIKRILKDLSYLQNNYVDNEICSSNFKILRKDIERYISIFKEIFECFSSKEIKNYYGRDLKVYYITLEMFLYYLKIFIYPDDKFNLLEDSNIVAIEQLIFSEKDYFLEKDCYKDLLLIEGRKFLRPSEFVPNTFSNLIKEMKRIELLGDSFENFILAIQENEVIKSSLPIMREPNPEAICFVLINFYPFADCKIQENIEDFVLNHFTKNVKMSLFTSQSLKLIKTNILNKQKKQIDETFTMLKNYLGEGNKESISILGFDFEIDNGSSKVSEVELALQMQRILNLVFMPNGNLEASVIPVFDDKEYYNKICVIGLHYLRMFIYNGKKKTDDWMLTLEEYISKNKFLDVSYSADLCVTKSELYSRLNKRAVERMLGKK